MLDTLENELRTVFNDKVVLSHRDVEEVVRVGFWPRSLPRAVKGMRRSGIYVTDLFMKELLFLIVSLASAELKEHILHLAKSKVAHGFDVVDDRPYGTIGTFNPCGVPSNNPMRGFSRKKRERIRLRKESDPARVKV